MIIQILSFTCNVLYILEDVLPTRLFAISTIYIKTSKMSKKSSRFLLVLCFMIHSFYKFALKTDVPH